jgi:hypothetical protein
MTKERQAEKAYGCLDKNFSILFIAHRSYQSEDSIESHERHTHGNHLRKTTVKQKIIKSYVC